MTIGTVYTCITQGRLKSTVGLESTLPIRIHMNNGRIFVDTDFCTLTMNSRSTRSARTPTAHIISKANPPTRSNYKKKECKPHILPQNPARSSHQEESPQELSTRTPHPKSTLLLPSPHMEKIKYRSASEKRKKVRNHMEISSISPKHLIQFETHAPTRHDTTRGVGRAVACACVGEYEGRPEPVDRLEGYCDGWDWRLVQMWCNTTGSQTQMGRK